MVERRGAVPQDLDPFLPLDMRDHATAPVATADPSAPEATSTASLAAASDRSLEFVATRVQTAHFICDDGEYTIIHGFMQQLTKQALIHFGERAACLELLRALAARTWDAQGHVHTWYWAGALAQQGRDFARALLFFKRAALCTHARPHLSMRGKALVASAECVLGGMATRCVPALTFDGFALAVAARGENADPLGLHAELCRGFQQHLADASDGTASGTTDAGRYAHAEAWPRRSALVTVQSLLRQALSAAHACDDELLELRALVACFFVLRVEGVVRARPCAHVEREQARSPSGACASGGYVWRQGIRVRWLEGQPCVGSLFVRWQRLLSRLRRNVLSLYRLVGVAVVLDPDCVWGKGDDGPVATAGM